MSDELEGLSYNWRGKYYKGAMRDYKNDLREAAELRLRLHPTEHRNTKRHRLGQQKRGDYYCDECRPTPVADEAKRQRKRERKRKA